MEAPLVSDFTLKLRRPVTLDGEEIEQITLRPPSVDGFVELLKVGEIEDEIDAAKATLAVLAEVPVEVIGKIDVRDFTELNEAAAPMIEATLAVAPAITRH